MQDFRADRATIKHWEETPEGFLRFTAPVGREGILTYKNKDGSVRREHVSADVLKDSADSLKIKPFTTPSHPMELVDKTTAQPFLAGSTGNTVWMDDGFLWVTGCVFDGRTIDAIKSGKNRELSLGYGVETIVRADGDFDQVKRHINHLSPVGRARASGAEFKLDSGESVEFLESMDSIDAGIDAGIDADVDADIDAGVDAGVDAGAGDEITPAQKVTEITKEIIAMPYKAMLDGIELEFPTMDEAKHVKGIEKELGKLRSDSASLTEKLDSKTVALDEAKSELGTIKATVVTQKTALDEAIATVETTKSEAMDGEAISSLIGDRMKLWSEVLPFIRSDSPDFEPDYTLSPLEIMAAAVKVANIELKDHIDGLDLADPENSGFVKGLYAGLNAKQFSTKSVTRANADSLLETIRSSRLDAATKNPFAKSSYDKGEMQAKKDLEEARKKRADRIATANKK